jgi:hypothetical protein
VSDIIIGARNPRPARVRKLLATAVVVAVVYAIVRWLFGSLVNYPNPDVDVGASVDVSATEGRNLLARGDDTLSRRGDLRVLRAGGSVGAIGVSTGWLLGADAAAAIDAHSLAAIGSRRRGLISRLLGGGPGDWRLRHVDDGVPGHQLVEIAGFAAGLGRAGARRPYADVVRAQASVDVGVPHPRSAGRELRAMTRSITVVAPISAGGGERLVLARSFAYPGLIDGGDAAAASRAVRLMRPAEVLGFASVGDAAQLGVLTGINAEGLAIAVHPLRTAETAASDTAQPVALLARDILENCRSVEQAVAVLESADPLGSAIYVVVDGTGREAVVVERTPETFGVRADKPPLVVVDILESTELADDPESERNRRRRPDAERAARARQILEKTPPASVGDLAALLRDRKGADGVERALGHRGAIADPWATHAAVIDPAAMVLWAADGPGVAGPLRAFDLRHELRGEGKRPAPPPDIAGLDREDEIASRAVVEASAVLRLARGAADRDRALELVGRALLIAPDLPEALMLAAELAPEPQPYVDRLREVGVDMPGERERFE